MARSESEISGIKFTIILNRLLPRREMKMSRIFVDGKKLVTDRIIKILTEDGHQVTHEHETVMALADNYKGIPLKPSNGGLMVCPKNPEDFEKLKEALLSDGYFYHSCYLPIKKNGNTRRT